MVRSNPTVARFHVEKRDRGICRDCGLDTLELAKAVKAAIEEQYSRWRADNPHVGRYRPRVARRAAGSAKVFVEDYARPAIEALLSPHGLSSWWWRKSFWDADHLLEVSRGGGECGLSNLATRCCACHAKRTVRQARARAERRRKVGGGARRVGRRPDERCRSVSVGGCAGRSNPCYGCRRYRARALGLER